MKDKKYMPRFDKTVEQCQAQFVLKALKDGWTVKMKANGELEFTKEIEDEMTQNDYSKKFLEKYGFKLPVLQI